MQSNLIKHFEKIILSFKKMDKLPKTIIIYGIRIFLFLFAVGTLLVVYNHTQLNYEPYFEFVALSIVKASFTILAEAIIGGLIIDYVFKR